MDRESADRESDELTLVEASRVNSPSGPIVVSVCVTCKTADGGTVVGPDMFECGQGRDRPIRSRAGAAGAMPQRLQAARDGRRDKPGRLHVPVRRSANRERHCGAGAFVKSYHNSDYGLVPWRERAEVLRKGMVARVPPLRWSPDDGARRNDGARHHAGAGRCALRQIRLCRKTDRRQRTGADLSRHRDRWR